MQAEEVIKTDISKLSKRQKLQILQKESPEFFGLVEDFKSKNIFLITNWNYLQIYYFVAKMIVVKDYLSPVLTKHKLKQIPSCKAINFVQSQYELILK